MFSLELIDGDVTVIKLETLITKVVSYRTYVSLVDGLLIDSGFSHAGRWLVKALAGRQVEQVVNTHGHEDHTGNNRLMVDRFQAALRAPTESLPLLQRPERTCDQCYQRAVWGLPDPSRAAPLGREVETSRFRFQVVPTPGHSSDHISLYEPERGWLFGGDLFLSVKVRVARPFENATDLMRSLKRVCALNPRIYFCYHRGVIHDPAPALQAKLRFMEDLQQQILQLHQAGAPVQEIARRLLGREPLDYRIMTRGDFSKVNLVRSFLKERGTGYEA